MFLGILLLLAGAALALAGVRIATSRPRPASLGGALLAPAGLVLVYLGIARLVVPGFFG